MRKLIVAASLLAFAVPAAAQPYPDPRDEDIVRALPHPGEVEALGRTMEDVTDAIMDVDVGPVVDAVHGRRHSRHHRETLGDIASRDDPYARERVRDQVGLATIGVSAAVREMAVLAPVLRRALDDAAHRVEDALARRHGRNWDRDHDRDYDPDWDHDERDGR